MPQPDPDLIGEIRLTLEMMYIYEIRNRINDKVYIGLCKDIEQRWPNHIAMLRSGKSHHTLLQQDFNEYGEFVYDFSVIDEAEAEIAQKKEKYHINRIPFSKTLNIQKREGIARNAFNRIVEIRAGEDLEAGTAIYLDEDSHARAAER